MATIKVFALATDGKNGTEATVYTDEREMYVDLLGQMGADEITADLTLEQVRELVSDTVPPDLFTYCIDEQEIEVPSDPKLAELCKCGAHVNGIIQVHHCDEMRKVKNFLDAENFIERCADCGEYNVHCTCNEEETDELTERSKQPGAPGFEAGA